MLKRFVATVAAALLASVALVGMSTVAAAPASAVPTISISPTTMPAMTVGVSATETFTASGGTAPYTFPAAGGLPRGLSLGISGTLTGVPTQAGDFTVSITVIDSAGYTAQQVYTLRVEAPLIVLAPSTLPNLTLGAAYSQSFTALGGTGPYTYAVSSGSLPAGLALTAFGLLSGTPTVTGTFDFTVTVTDSTTGTGPFTASRSYTGTVAQVPTVAGISPTSGPPAGGAAVTITGTGLTGATAVTFGSAAASSFVVNSDTTITALAPAGSGTADVRVTTPNGTSAISASDQFSYVAPPTVTAVSPSSGTIAGGTSVAITGTGFTHATAVAFRGVAATSFTVNSDTSITAVAPEGTAGQAHVTVTSPAGTSATSAADGFMYLAPVLASGPTLYALSGQTTPIPFAVDWQGLPIAGVYSVDVTGPGHGHTTQLSGSISSGQLSIDTFEDAGYVGADTLNVYYSTQTAQSTQIPIGTLHFTVVAPAAVTGVSPASGDPAGGATVTITGAGFTGATGVDFGAIPATSFAVVDDTTITAVVPAGAAGDADVTVVGRLNTSATSAADVYSYVAPAPPVSQPDPTATPTPTPSPAVTSPPSHSQPAIRPKPADKTKPTISITGVKANAVYLGRLPAVHCKATDNKGGSGVKRTAKSGAGGCTVTKRTKAGASGTTVTFTAVAVDKAGNKATKKLTVHLVNQALKGAKAMGGVYLVRQGARYTLEVTSRIRPQYVHAAPSPQRPRGAGGFFTRAGSVGGVPRWRLTVTIDVSTARYRDWNLGVLEGGTLKIVRVRL